MLDILIICYVLIACYIGYLFFAKAQVEPEGIKHALVLISIPIFWLPWIIGIVIVGIIVGSVAAHIDSKMDDGTHSIEA